MNREKLSVKALCFRSKVSCDIYVLQWGSVTSLSTFECVLPIAGVRPILTSDANHSRSLESSCLGMQLKVGGKPHLKLNTDVGPIANKYREGKLKRTLKREWISTWNRWGVNARVSESCVKFSWDIYVSMHFSRGESEMGQWIRQKLVEKVACASVQVL